MSKGRFGSNFWSPFIFIFFFFSRKIANRCGRGFLFLNSCERFSSERGAGAEMGGYGTGSFDPLGQILLFGASSAL